MVARLLPLNHTIKKKNKVERYCLRTNYFEPHGLFRTRDSVGRRGTPARGSHTMSQEH